MAKAVFVHANEAQASLVNGPRLTTKQPSGSPTVVIAIVGIYATKGVTKQPLNKHDSFLALLSTENHPKTSHHNKSEEQQLQGGQHVDAYSFGIIHGPLCARYMNLLRDCRAPRLCRNNTDHFCATRGNCYHGPPPSMFPGDKSWTFATGEASFDAARVLSDCRSDPDDSPAPEVTDAHCALDALEGLLRTAVGTGLVGLKVVVSASDVITASGIHGTTFEEELQALVSRVLEVVIDWVERGWVRRDQLEVVWRPFDTTRSFGLQGYQNSSPFVICDER